MNLAILLFVFMFGLVAGIYLCKMFSKEEINTDMCMDYLKERGYYVNLNILPKK